MIDLDSHNNEGNQGEKEDESLHDLDTDLAVDEVGEAEFLLLATLVGDNSSSALVLVIDSGNGADVLLDVAAVGLDRGRHGWRLMISQKSDWVKRWSDTMAETV